MTLLENPRQRKAAECQAMAIIIRPLIYCDIMQLSSCLYVCLSLNCANVNVRSSKTQDSHNGSACAFSFSKTKSAIWMLVTNQIRNDKRAITPDWHMLHTDTRIHGS